MTEPDAFLQRDFLVESPVFKLNENLKKYSCSVCDGLNVALFMDSYFINSFAVTSKSKSSFEFVSNPCFCYTCGHIFNANPPSLKFLTNYYRDQVGHIAEDFDSAIRVNWHTKSLSKIQGCKLLDFGSNNRNDFHTLLEKYGFSVTTYDLALDTERILGEFDVITCYFVLEHIVDLAILLIQFSLASHIGTKLIVEVPGSEIYDKNYSGLLYEHQQHFQIASLDFLCSRFGFKKINSSWKYCSRKFGFVSTLLFVGMSSVETRFDFEDTRLKYVKGRYHQLEGEMYYPVKFIRDNGIIEFSTIFFWGINANYETIMSHLNLSERKLYAIDINRNKSSYLKNLVEYLHPNDFFEKFKCLFSDVGDNIGEVCMVVTASEHRTSINLQLELFKGRVFIYDPTYSSD